MGAISREPTVDRRPYWCYLAVSGGFLAFILYASFFRDFGPDSRIALGTEQPWLSFRRLSRSGVWDISVNVLLYVPLGALVALTLACRQRIRMFSTWLVLGLLISLGIEHIQRYIQRQPDVLDVISNAVGYGLGYFLIAIAQRWWGLDAAGLLGMGQDRDRDRRDAGRQLTAVRFLYVMVMLLVQLLPFDLSVRATEIYAKLHAATGETPRILVDPFYHWHHASPSAWHQMWISLLGFIPLGALTARVGWHRGRCDWVSAVGGCILLALVIEGAQLFLRSATSDISTLFLAAAGGALGWGAVRWWGALEQPGHQRPQRLLGQRLAYSWLGCALLIALYQLSPYTFELKWESVLHKLRHESNLVPFRSHFHARSVSAAVDLLREFALGIPLGAITAWILAQRQRSRVEGVSRPAALLRNGDQLERPELICLVSSLVSLGLGGLVESLQVVVQGRTVDLTDVLLLGCGGLMGAVWIIAWQRTYAQPTMENRTR